MFKLLGFILLFGFTSTSMAGDIPDFTANYLVKLNGIQAGELVRTLRTEASGMRLFTSRSQAKGMFAFFKPDVIEESSLWAWHEDKVRPQEYLYQRTGGKKEKWLQMTFDWDKMVARIDDKKHPWQLKLEPGTLDKLVYQISLMHDLADGMTEIDYRIADGGNLKTYEIRAHDTETITTPLGKIEVVKLTRHREKPSDRETTLWCAPALNYMPVMLEHEEDGTRFTAVLRRLKGMDAEKAFTPIENTSRPSPLTTP